MQFKIGDNVSVLDDDFSGTVVKIEAHEITIKTDDGFQLSFLPEQLIKMGGQELIMDDSQIAHHESEERTRPSFKKRKKVKKGNRPVFEVDLHIEKLLPSSRGMTQHDILTYQLETARRQLEFAIEKRMQRLVFIHGVGDGVLKLELEYLLGRYSHISFQEADYQKYGLGATEVYIKQGANRL